MKSSSKSIFNKKNINKKAKLLLNFLNTVPGQITKLVSIIAIVIFLSWSLTNATSSEFESSKDNFSMIGKVSSISDNSIDLIDARKSGADNEDIYSVNIEFVNKIETSKYEPLIISDIEPGYTIIIQGVTNGEKFFAVRIISFSERPLPNPEDMATSTPDEIVDENATSTEEVNLDESAGGSSEPVNSGSEDTSTTTIDSPVENTSTSSESDNSNDSSNPTITEIIEDGVDTVVDIIGSIAEIITGSDDSQTTPEPESEPVPEPEPEPEPTPEPSI